MWLVEKNDIVMLVNMVKSNILTYLEYVQKWLSL